MWYRAAGRLTITPSGFARSKRVELNESLRQWHRRRYKRARALAERYPASQEGLLFYADIVQFQSRTVGRPPLESRPELVELVSAKGTDLLRQTARDLDESRCRESIEAYLSGKDRSSPRSFFARVLLQGSAPSEPTAKPNAPHLCPDCGHPPQAASLKPAGHGTALELCCSLCTGEWSFPGQRCAACGETSSEKLAFFQTDELPHLRVSACESCRKYLHSVDLAVDGEAIAFVDELAALPLDLWVHERGFRKIQPNLLGI